ncbi:hypothetical protein DQP55_12040 [Mycolicibacterium sp. GF69]|uniref:hypothetical protein n=1 Tax=Mycolicibacterium sp. GF69 TaxID=2267251 RepID=UPI000DCEA0BA|nr:hypothetical protein [Mycolicibacterium sp. GF69]RAV12351.1 hypothetical protein DQP55_12040 [Mycolicibacterium sp. GF69]
MSDVELRTAKEVDGEITASGVVGVLAFIAHRRRQACCSCGWRGQVRWLLPRTAAVDALTHAGNRGCTPAVPLVARVAADACCLTAGGEGEGGR